MDTVLCKRKKCETQSTSKASSIKNFIKGVVSPRKKRKLLHEPDNQTQEQMPTPAPIPVALDLPENTFITSSPKPKLTTRTPQKSFRKTLTKENNENEKITQILSPRTPKSVSEPINRSLSFDDAIQGKEEASTEEILFSPIFNKQTGLRRSYTSLGCVSPQDTSKYSLDTEPLELLSLREEIVPIIPNIAFNLRSDESLEDELSDSDSVDTFEINPNDDDILNESSVEEIELNETTVEYEHDVDSLYFIKYVPPIPASYSSRSPHLPPKRPDAPKITLVLDLDETLVHCETSPLENPDYQFPVEFHGHLYQVFGRKRPFVDKFLSKVAQLFEIVIFTASQQVYADYILDELDNNGVIDHKLFRDSCVHVNGNYLKDLNILGRDLDKVVIVDNSITAFAYQVENGIPIISWYEDTKDRELLDLIPFLEKLALVDDVRPHLRKAFKIQQQIDSLPLQ